jgi:Fe-S-cluster containining protein
MVLEGGEMPEKERHFFSIDEALEAVRSAFAQYPSQLNLLRARWPMVFGDSAYILPGNRHRTAWTKFPGKAKLILSGEDDLKQHIMDQLNRWPPTANRLADICSQIFGVHATPGIRPGPGAFSGIWIDIDMSGFECLQCGHCCRTLNYHDGCSVSDYQRWLDLDRTDILAWVGTVREKGRVSACRIWMLPGTNRFAEECPWLKRRADQKSYVCTIHDVRPKICRQYPGSRKHARLTGCRGV